MLTNFTCQWEFLRKENRWDRKELMYVNIVCIYILDYLHWHPLLMHLYYTFMEVNYFFLFLFLVGFPFVKYRWTGEASVDWC